MAWFLVARGFSVLGGMAAAFYTVYAMEALGVPAWHVGFFTTALLVGEMVANLALGWLADRAGHRVVLAVGVSAALVANVAALISPTAQVFMVVFVLLGVQWGAIHVSGLNILLEFAPSVEQRPTYIGLGTTLLAPVLFGAPLLGGVVVDRLGFPAIFALAAAFGAMSLVIFLTRVRDPRW
jgi:MFS family permease